MRFLFCREETQKTQISYRTYKAIKHTRTIRTMYEDKISKYKLTYHDPK